MRALITGASSGIGKAIAYELAFLHHDVVLVARRENLLKEICLDIEKKFNVSASYIVADLTSQTQLNDMLLKAKDITY